MLEGAQRLFGREKDEVFEVLLYWRRRPFRNFGLSLEPSCYLVTLEETFQRHIQSRVQQGEYLDQKHDQFARRVRTA